MAKMEHTLITQEKDRQIAELWEQFSDIPVDSNDEIEEVFYTWEVGADRLEIWHWFDEMHSKGLVYLMYGIGS